ncbi:MAG: RNA pseudouridine synthase [Alphaproteobacteria bacterium]|nr:RNA pseudouridine synthase [Alphaproteobacteria bacterium]
MTSASDLVARVLHRDAHMLVLDKPAGLPVHRGPKGGDSLEDYFDQLLFDLPRRPRLAHRLDRETSGCLVLGRHRKALARLGVLFAAGAVTKTYWAVVEGAPPARAGRIDLALARRSPERGWWMKVAAAGQPAVTDYRVLGAGCGRAWLELTPRTGRTHQIRVHLAAIGCPVLGDAIYGRAPRAGGPPLHLHAQAVVVPLQPGQPVIEVAAPLPQHMAAAVAACAPVDDGSARKAS